jgi:PPM family protein phosphatase
VAFNFYARSDPGLRDINEDCYCAERIGDYSVFAVADGLGGYAAGEVASAIAIDCLRNAFKLDGGDPKHALQEAVSEADKQILEHGEKSPDSRGMATTFIAAVVDDELNCMVINIGDSRAHFITADDITTTKDHSFVNELVETGGNTTRGHMETSAGKCIVPGNR